MELTLQLTPVQMQALKTAYPDHEPAEAALMLLRSEMDRRCRMAKKAGVLRYLQALKRVRA